ncbi:DUF1707 SHOCT-like domain-containing protein [Amycolatopsis anabasis]|uniref:DUF1707 SHOCT-like domain-containing protein n=1 Tax=Amycolatopsis anabasis TaxID=1840409 RepID=UPI00131C65FE|nr:DUF1707 domain-containing protein [Amycolatopsis anabasis]
MSEVPASQLRISDADRESALQALGEHMSAGRISLDEYGERSAKITAVKTRGELAEVFADLPQPHPRLEADPEEPKAPAAPPAPAEWSDRPLVQRLAAAAVPLSAVLGVVLFFVTGTWLWFLMPAAIAAAGSALWGKDWKHRDREIQDRHRQIREHHREVREAVREHHRELHDNLRAHRRELRNHYRGRWH